MKFHITTILLLTLCLQCVGQEQRASDAELEGVNGIFKQYDNSDSPGVAITVIRNGRTILTKGYGMANLEHKVAIDPEETVFNIASASKQFTVFAVMLLEKDGKLSLDDDVRKYIPELPDYGKKISLRHLAVHTSGIRSELQLLALAGWTPGDVITREQVLNMIYRQKNLNFDPGENNAYSNSGYTLLSEVVARVSGQPFEDIMASRILKPLGMNDSFFISSFQTLIPNMAYSYSRYQNTNYRAGANEGYAGSTGLFTTAKDLAKWALNYRDLKIGGKEVVNKMNTLGKLNNGNTFGFAHGQFIEKYRGLKHIQHGGSSGGYVSYLGRFPDQDFSVLLLGNSSSINARELSLRIADIFLKDSIKEENQSEKNAFSVSSSELERYAGNYWNKTDRTINVSTREGGLVYDIGGGPTLNLEPIAKDTFRMIGTGTEVKVKFTKRDAKYQMQTVVSGRIEDTYVPFKRRSYTSKELKQFTGTYYSKELDTVYTLVFERDSLRLQHIRFGSVPLTPVASNFFTGGTWRFSSIRFEKLNGRIDGFRVNSMRVKNISFKRLR